MRFMVIIKANKDSEAGVLPDESILTEMGKYNEELVKAGVLLAGEGLHPSSKGARVKFSGAQRIIIDGPFAETKELIAGFWLWQVKSKAEAIEWLKRAPFEEGAEVVRLEHPANLEFRPGTERRLLQPLDGFVHRPHLPQPEAGDELLAFRKRSVNHRPLIAAEPDPLAL